jgi:CHASE2 domain-containing sensor protein
VKVKSNRSKGFIRSASGAVLVILGGLLLWSAGEAWVNTSYDYLFRFGSPRLTNNVVLIQLDNEAYDHFTQTRGERWDRSLHADLLNRLADDGCSMVVIDAFFGSPDDPATDEALAAAMRRQRGIVVMAEQARVTHPDFTGARSILPAEPFLSAVGTNYGVAWLDPDLGSNPDLDSIVRRHWPFPSPGPYPSLSETAARLAGVQLDDRPRKRWLRYYGPQGAWTEISYRFALLQPPDFFRNRIVFIGSHPKTPLPGDVDIDEFSNPYTRWTRESTGGVEIHITGFLNLINGDWLRRAPPWIEVLILIGFGIALGGGLWRLKLQYAFSVVAGVMVLGTVAGILVSHITNYWFPWLIVVAGQAPLAVGWVLLNQLQLVSSRTRTVVIQQPSKPEPLLDIPGYELFRAPFGEGAYGKVWLARQPAGPWEALKVVYLAKFDKNTEPYEREFKGVNRYRMVSDEHPGLLRVKFVSEKQSEYFYYIMELGDGIETGWENDPATYKPRDLVNVRAHLPGKRLPTLECIRIALILCDALEFLHQKGLTHRDIKPQNVIFVNGQPKLADVGLIAEIRPPDQERTMVGTPGYMPPPPEVPGTPQADIYALGMVLYVLSTGSSAALFPEISSTLVESKTPVEFYALNAVIIKACQPDLSQRFSTVSEMINALKLAQQKLETAVRTC